MQLTNWLTLFFSPHYPPYPPIPHPQDVVSKQDLPIAADQAADAAAALAAVPDAVRVSITTGEGVGELERRLLGMLGVAGAVRVLDGDKGAQGW